MRIMFLNQAPRKSAAYEAAKIEAQLNTYTWRILRAYGLDRFVSDIRPLGVYGKDIAQRKQEIFDITTKLIRGLIDETRAEIILPLGGALIPYVVNPDDLAKAAGVQ